MDLDRIGHTEALGDRGGRLAASRCRAREQSQVIVRQLVELGAQRRAQAFGERNPRRGQRRIGPLAEIPAGGGGLGGRVPREDEGAHGCRGV